MARLTGVRGRYTIESPTHGSVRLLSSVLLLTVLVAACRIETRVPAGVARTQATIQAAVTEHYRTRTFTASDSVEYLVQRRQTDVRRDLASVWVTLRERHFVRPDSVRDTVRTEHLLLRRSDQGWVVLAATPVLAP